MEKLLTNAGFAKIDANRYEHPERGRLYRNERNGRWYLQAKGGHARLMGRTLRDAIGKVLEVAA